MSPTNEAQKSPPISTIPLGVLATNHDDKPYPCSSLTHIRPMQSLIPILSPSLLRLLERVENQAQGKRQREGSFSFGQG